MKFEIQRLQFQTYFEKVPDRPNTLCNNYLFLPVDLQNLGSFYKEKEELDLLVVLITHFTEPDFQSLFTFPYVNIQKQGNSWVVKVAVSKSLYHYPYPFSFPNTFLTYKNIDDLKAELKVIQAISKVPLEKVFYVEVFLEQFNVPTKNKAIIKKQIVKVFNQLQTAGIIKNNYKLIKKNHKK